MLLDGLLGLLSLSGLLEGLGRDGSLQALEFEGVSGRKQVGVVHNLDERLDLGSLGDSLGAHRLVDLQGVPEESPSVPFRGNSKAMRTDFSIPATMAWG